MTTVIFTQFLRALDASIGLQGGDILLCANNCAFAARFVTAKEYNVQASFSSYASVGCELYIPGISSKDELHYVQVRGSNSGEEKERM